MILQTIPSGPIRTNGYLLIEEGAGKAALVDAPGEIWQTVQKVLQQKSLSLSHLFLTHAHWDHIQDAALIARETGAQVFAHPADREMLEQPEMMAAFSDLSGPIPPVSVDHWLTAGETVQWCDHQIEVRAVPGHCPGSVLYYFPKAALALVGDAIFRGSVGRTDFPGGDFGLLGKAIREQVYTLPPKTTLYPGHGPATSVERERRDNPFVHD